ncbi:hypothetical protein ACH5RR_023040 [Cinchona calisaya]|uniref:Uncharacterized protein n=1 Tax=Cinchona calisaya TaxID=153742 RepID=A0ABD2ZEH0_9GENT
MSLSVNLSDLKPHIPELAEFIAEEIDINASQVHLVKLTSKGNDSLIKLAIHTAGSADFMSNAAAMDIVSRLAENCVHLPSNYGSYKLFE